MSLRILAVDDSELLHRMYDLMLVNYKTAGVGVDHAMNGQEALDRLDGTSDIGLILLDIQMPVMGGLEFLRKRAEDDKLASIPVIVISTRGREEDTSVAMKLGADGYLTKPFQPADLRKMISGISPGFGGVEEGAF